MKTFLFILFFVFLINNGLAQNIFNVDFDASRFSETDTSGRIELYYSFYHEDMKTKISESDTLINGMLNVKLSTPDKSQLFLDKKYSFDQPIDSRQKATTGVLKYSLSVGRYLCELKGHDLNQDNVTDSVSFIFNIEGFNSKQFSISDIQLAASLFKSRGSSKSVFFKNGYEVVPNVSGIYGETLPVLYFYSELYNLDRGTKSTTLRVSYEIENQYSEILYSKEKNIPTKASSIVFAEAANVSAFPNGSYKMHISATDDASGLTDKSTTRFTIINPSVVDTHQTLIAKDVLSSEFASMDEEQLDKVFGFSTYIASKGEVNVWKSLKNITEKRNYLYNFWKQRDEDKSTPVNRYKNTFFNRAEIASKRFETLSKEGWKTDRGRVFCLFGEPNEIERYPNEDGSRPYEIWNYYSVEGGVVFVFAEVFTFTDMRLIHSTKNGELYDPNWKNKILR